MVLTSVTRIVTLYTVIKSFRHRGLERFFRTGSKAGIQPKHAARLRLQLFALDNARRPGDMNAPGWRLHPLGGTLKNHWAIMESETWHVTFRFEDEDAILVVEVFKKKTQQTPKRVIKTCGKRLHRYDEA